MVLSDCLELAPAYLGQWEQYLLGNARPLSELRESEQELAQARGAARAYRLPGSGAEWLAAVLARVTVEGCWEEEGKRSRPLRVGAGPRPLPRLEG